MNIRTRRFGRSIARLSVVPVLAAFAIDPPARPDGISWVELTMLPSTTYEILPGDLLRPAQAINFQHYVVHWASSMCGRSYLYETSGANYGDVYDGRTGGAILAPPAASASHVTIESRLVAANMAEYWCPCETWASDWGSGGSAGPFFHPYLTYYSGGEGDFGCHPLNVVGDVQPGFDWITIVWPRKPCASGVARFIPAAGTAACGELQLSAAGTAGDSIDVSGWYSIDGSQVRIPVSRTVLPGEVASIPVCDEAPGCQRLQYHLTLVSRSAGEICSTSLANAIVPLRSAIPCNPEWHPVNFRTPHSTSVVMGVRGLVETETIIERQSPLAGWSVRWRRTLEEAGAAEWITDGAQSSGSLITGSETPILRMTGFSEHDIGTYEMFVIPPGGTVADAVLADACDVVDDIGQPRFLLEPQPATICGASPLTIGVELDPKRWDDVSEIRLIADGVPLILDAQGSSRRFTLPNGIAFSLQRQYYSPLNHVISDPFIPAGITDPTFQLECVAVNSVGQTHSCMVPISFECGAPELTINPDTSLDVVTRAFQGGSNAFTIRVRASLDDGMSWREETIAVTHAAPGTVTTRVPPRRPAGNRVAPLRVEVAVQAGCGEIGTWTRSLPATGYVPTCLSADIDPSDFRCATCPTVVKFRGGADQHFLVERRVPPGSGTASWAYVRPGVPPTPITDGPTGRGNSVATGAATPILRIDHPGAEDIGDYVMIVTPPAGQAFIADRVPAELWSADDPCMPFARNPDPVKLCSGSSAFTLVASPGAETSQQVVQGWQVDGVPLEATNGNSGTFSSDGVSFDFVLRAPGILDVSSYAASTLHTFASTAVVRPCGCDWCSSDSRSFDTPVFVDGSECGSCIADLNTDSVVNGADLGVLLGQWGPATAGTVSDINHDGFVNGADLGLLLGQWGACTN